MTGTPEQEQDYRLDILNDCLDKLTPWEQDFVQSVTRWFDSDRQLSEKQAATLLKIYTRTVVGHA